MYAERRLAFEKRIGELLSDHRNAYPASRNVSNNQWRDIASRILSALEDSFQMGKKASPEAEQEIQELTWSQNEAQDASLAP